MRQAVKQAISAMHDRYYDPITLRELAADVFVSPFHFSRVFSKETGITPGRYLTAIRLFEAKRLLLTTSLTVSDIVCSVGYSSVGTFTTRFTQAVGMTPTQYRDPEVSQLLIAVAPDFNRMPSFETLRCVGKTCARVHTLGGSISGRIIMPVGLPKSNVLVGVFADRIPQCGPVAYKALPNVGSTGLTIPNVPGGRWHVIAIAQEGGGDGGHGKSLFMGVSRTPVTVVPGRETIANLRMGVVSSVDPPMAVTLAANSSMQVDRNRFDQPRHLRSVA